MVVRQVDGAQVLEVTEIFFNDLHDILGIKFGFDSLVRELDPAGVKNQETVKKLSASTLELLGSLNQIGRNMLRTICWHWRLLLGVLETPLGLNWVNDAINRCCGHLEFNTLWAFSWLLFPFGRFPSIVTTFVDRTVVSQFGCFSACTCLKRSSWADIVLILGPSGETIGTPTTLLAERVMNTLLVGTQEILTTVVKERRILHSRSTTSKLVYTRFKFTSAVSSREVMIIRAHAQEVRTSLGSLAPR